MGYLGNQITTVFPTSISLDTVTASTSLKTPLVEFTNGDNAFTISDGGNVAFTGTVTGTGANTPYFYGKKASNQTITRNTDTKITGFTADELDTDNAFDGTTFTVPSGKAGRYYFHATTASDFSGIGSDGERALLYAYKNGSAVIFNDFFLGSSYNVAQVSNSFSWILDLSASDTVEIYIFNKDGNASGNAFVSDGSIFFGYRLV